MNVLYVAGHIRDADFVEHEMGKIAPEFCFDFSPGTADAGLRLDKRENWDAILLDASIPLGDCLGLIARIRKEQLPLAIVALTAAGSEEIPAELLDTGADDYLSKRPRFVRHLPDLLRRTVEKRRMDAERRNHPLSVLYVGDPQEARVHLESACMGLEAAACGPEGTLEGPPDSGKLPNDVVVLDSAAPNIRTIQLLKEIKERSSEVPVIVLADAETDRSAVHALKLGAADCVVKVGDYYPRLVAAIEKAVRSRREIRERSALLLAEARLRLLIETLPACIIIVSADSRIQACNWAGFPLLGLKRADQVLGKSILEFAQIRQRKALKDFVEHVCAGGKGAIRFELDSAGGTSRRLELRAVPMRRDSGRVVVALGVLSELPGQDEDALEGSEAERAASGGRVERIDEAERTMWELERKELESRREALELALRTVEADKERLREKLDSMESERQEAEKSRASEREERERTTGALERRQAELEKVMQAAEAARMNEGEALEAERREWETAQADLERRLREAEEVRGSLEETLRATEAELRETRNLRKSEREEWMAARRSLDDQKEGLADTVRTSDADRAQAVEALTAERRKREETEAELRRAVEDRSTLEAALRAVEEDHAAVSERQWMERAEWQGTQRELELRQAWMADTIHALELRRTDLEERYRSESLAWEDVEEDLQKQRAWLEEALAASETARRRIFETGEAERKKLEASLSESEDKRRLLENKARELEQNRADLEERYRSDKREWQESREDLERHIVWLEEALRSSETARERDSEAHETELGKLRAKLEESEEKRAKLLETARALELRGTELEDALRVSESRIKEMEALASELSESESSRAKLADTVHALELRRKEAEEALRISEAVREEESEGGAAERTRLEAELRENQASSAKLEDTVHALELRRTELARVHESLERKHAGLQERLRQSEDARALESENRSRIEAELWESLAKEAKLQDGIHALELRGGELKEALRRSESVRERESEAHAAERAGLEADLREKEDAIAKLLDTVHALELRRSEQATACEGLAHGYSGLEEKLRESERMQAREAETGRELQTALQDGLAREAKLKDMVRSLKLRGDELEETRAELERRLSDLEDALRSSEDARKKESEMLAKLEAELDDARAQMAKLGKTMHELESRRGEIEERFRRESRAWEEERRQWKQSGQDLLERNRALLGKLEETKQHRNHTERELAERRSEAEVMSRELDQLRTARIEAENTLNAAQARCARILEEQEAERAEWETVQEELKRQRSARLALEDALRASEERRNQVLEERKADRSVLQAVREELERQSKVRNALEGSLRAAEERLSRMMEQLRRTRRMESIGRLATETVRALEELLSSVGAYNEILKECLEENDPRRLHADRLGKVMMRAGSLARQLLAISRRQEHSTDRLDIGAAAREWIPNLRSLAGGDIELVLRPVPELGLVAAEREDVEQALTNLIVNVRNAMPVGGVLTMAASLERGEAERVGEGEILGPQALISFQAEGFGMLEVAGIDSLTDFVSKIGGALRAAGDTETGFTFEIRFPVLGSSAGESQTTCQA